MPDGCEDSEIGVRMSSEGDWQQNLYVGRKIAQIGGLILEIGEGTCRKSCQSDPMVQNLISDLFGTVVTEWKRLPDQEMSSLNFHYAVFDFCDMPLADGCVDVVSDHGGVINCIGDRSKALREVYRVLKPGGALVSDNGFMTKDVLYELLGEYTGVEDDLYEEMVLAGFRKMDSSISGFWTMEQEKDSGLAKLAEK